MSALSDIERTELGKTINHQNNKNAVLKQNGDIYTLHAAKDIEAGEELTMDYRQTPWFIDGDVKGYKELS